MPRPPLKPAVLHQIARLFFVAGKPVRIVVSEMKRHGVEVSSHQVYDALRQMHKKGVIQYLPEGNARLEEKIRASFPNVARRGIHVVDGFEAVPIKAAQLAHAVLQEEWKRRDARRANSEDRAPPIGIGLGPGSTTRDFATYIRPLLEEDRAMGLRISLFALAAGAPAEAPHVSPISFFNEFPQDLVANKLGLFAPNLVRVRDYEHLKKTPGVVEAFERRNEIFLYITSMGDATDDGDWLSQFLRKQSAAAGGQIAHYRGNVQYRPYDDQGPVCETQNDYRAVTLVELDELVQCASNQHVILMARGKKRDAMIPLLTRLVLFSQVVMDVDTAIEVIGRADG